MLPENFLPLFESLAPVVRSVLRRVSRWRTPANWSRTEWVNEERAVISLAVCQTVTEHATESVTQLAHLVYFQALSRALTRYRQECTYSQRFLALAPMDDSDDLESTDSSQRPSFLPSIQINRAPERVNAALESLSQSDSDLIQQLFWHGRAQLQIARDLHISQRAVSERRRRVLNVLRIALDPCGQESSIQLLRTTRNRKAKNICNKMQVEVLKNDSQSNIDSRDHNSDANRTL